MAIEFEERLQSAAKEVAFRVVLAERNFQRVLARQQQAEAATLRVRRLRDRARGDLRLIAALLEEKETFFEEEGGEAEIGVQQTYTGRTLFTPCCAPKLPPPGTDSPSGDSPIPRLMRSPEP